MCPAKRMELAHVDKLTHSAIRFCGVKLHSAFKANGFNNKFRQLTNGKFLTCTYIDMAVAYLAKRRNSTATTFRIVSVNRTVGLGTIEHAAVLLYAYNVLEVYIQ